MKNHVTHTKINIQYNILIYTDLSFILVQDSSSKNKVDNNCYSVSSNSLIRIEFYIGLNNGTDK